MPLTTQQIAREFELRNCGFFYADEIEDESVAGRQRIVDKLTTAAKRLYAEARRYPLPWHYQPAYHRMIVRLCKAEMAALEAMQIEQRRAA